MRIALPGRDLIEAEELLRSSADHDSAEWVDIALRTLVASCRKTDVRPPRVVAVRVTDHSTELVLGTSTNAADVLEPFEASEDGSSWRLPRSNDLLGEVRADPWVAGMDVLSPGLVTLGRDQRGLLLVDLEQAGSLAVAGVDSDDVLRAMAIELASSRWSEQTNVVIVGPVGGPPRSHAALDTLDRVRIAADVVELLPELRHIASERELMLEAVGLDKSSDARLSMSGDGWDLTVVFCGSAAEVANPNALEELVSLAGDGSRGIAVVCAGASTVRTNWHLNVGNGPATLDVAGVQDSMLWPQAVGRDAGSQIARIVDVAHQFEGVEPSGPPYDSIEPDLSRPDDSGAPPAAIEVRVLGSVEVVGAARPFTRAWSLELVVYLAMHREGASTDQWATHLWPNRSMAQASLHSTASAARRALGSSANGEDHLPRSHGRLALGPGVATDWDRFCRLAAMSDPRHWAEALGLVRGRPFDGLRSTDWAVFSHVQANIESLVVDVSVKRSEHCLSVGDPAGAEWASRQGLLVSPYDERLFRILMRAADVAGNPAGVEAVMAELLQLVGDEIEPYDSVHPETYELYRSLSRRQAWPSRNR